MPATRRPYDLGTLPWVSGAAYATVALRLPTRYPAINSKELPKTSRTRLRISHTSLLWLVPVSAAMARPGFCASCQGPHAAGYDSETQMCRRSSGRGNPYAPSRCGRDGLVPPKKVSQWCHGSLESLASHPPPTPGSESGACERRGFQARGFLWSSLQPHPP